MMDTGKTDRAVTGDPSMGPRPLRHVRYLHRHFFSSAGTVDLDGPLLPSVRNLVVNVFTQLIRVDTVRHSVLVSLIPTHLILLDCGSGKVSFLSRTSGCSRSGTGICPSRPLSSYFVNDVKSLFGLTTRNFWHLLSCPVLWMFGNEL